MQRYATFCNFGVFIAAALLGTAAAIVGVRWRYAAELEQVRRQRPAARLCSYEYRQMEMVLAPCGALVGIVLAEWVLSRRPRRASEKLR